MSLAASDSQLFAVGLAACRVAGVCLFGPVLASAVVPRRVALAFAVALGLAALPSVLGAGVVPTQPTLTAFVAGAIAELATGALLGLVAVLPLAAFRSAGSLASVQMGVGFGALYEGGESGGGSGSEGVEQLLALGGVAMFVWAGGLESLSLGVLRSFDYVPLAHWPDMAGIPALLAGAFLACSELTLRIAMPVTVVLVAEVLVTGLISRAVPGLGPVQFGFPVRVAVGLLALAAGAAAMQDVMTGASGAALDLAHAWMTGGHP